MTAAPTLEDVAARVGVSVRTVSRVLRDEGGYSAATEQRVRDVVDELRYAPNLLARRLVGRRSGVIGVLGPDMADPLVSAFTGRLERAARRRELTALSASTFGDPDQQHLVLASLRTCGVDGVIAHPVTGTDEQFRRLAASGTPVVAIGHDWTEPGLASVVLAVGTGRTVEIASLVADGGLRPALTIADDDRARIAEAAVDTLAELIAHPDAVLEPVVVSVELVDRAST